MSKFVSILATLFTFILASTALGQEVSLRRRPAAGPDYVQARADEARLDALARFHQAEGLVDQAARRGAIEVADAETRRHLVEAVAGCIGESPQEEQWRCQGVMNLLGFVTLAAPGPYAGNPAYVAYNTAALAGGAWRLANEAKTDAEQAAAEASMARRETGELATATAAAVRDLRTGLATTNQEVARVRTSAAASAAVGDANDRKLAAALLEIQRRLTAPPPATPAPTPAPPPATP